MYTSKNYLLEKQAWELYYKLSTLAYSRTLFELANPELKTYKYRVAKLANRAFDRWVRRENKLFHYNPGGFAPPSAQPSGFLGQGAFIDGMYFECDCSECDCLNCGVCGS